jgi:hypothetical protein
LISSLRTVTTGNRIDILRVLLHLMVRASSARLRGFQCELPKSSDFRPADLRWCCSFLLAGGVLAYLVGGVDIPDGAQLAR